MSDQVAGQTQDFYFNPWDEAFRANPYPHYKPLYTGSPRILDLGVKFALAVRYSDVHAILMDHATFSSVQKDMVGFEAQEDLFGNAATMLGSDPPIHTRLRRLVARDFTPRRIRELEPGIREITTMLIDKAAAKGDLDVMADLATPLPVMVIAELPGVAPEKYGKFKSWSDKVIESDNVIPGTPIPADIKAVFHELREFFADQIEYRRRNPGPDLVSALVAHHDADAEALSANELLQFVILLLLAGNETTTNLIGNGMNALARHPEAMSALRAKPELLRGTIEEMLRYDGPVQSTVRVPTRECEIGGTTLAPKMPVFVIVAAANRDHAQFADPDRLDITRTPNEHVAFGDGIHFCIGAPLARLEAAIAFETALARFPNLRLKDAAAPLIYKGSYFLRGLSSLPMTI
jgi:cytochrome P450